MRLAIIGTYPPPYGGVSIHIQRLKRRLEETKAIFRIFNLGTASSGDDFSILSVGNLYVWLWRQLVGRNPYEIVHLNTGSSWILRIFFGVVFCPLKNKKFIITWHGNDLSWPYAINSQRNPASGLRAKILAKLVVEAFKRADAVICVNKDGERLLRMRGIAADRISTISPFIPPVECRSDFEKIPAETWSFVSEHDPVVTANAYRISFYKDQEIYGIDMCIDLCAKLKKIYPRIGFVFCLPEIGDRAYYKNMKKNIAAAGIESNFVFLHHRGQYYPLLSRSSLFVRPTNTDGDAVSLREALHYRIPSVASDAAPRPEGTVLFRTRDPEDFFDKTKQVLDRLGEFKKTLASLQVDDNFLKILDIYRKVGFPAPKLSKARPKKIDEKACRS